MKRAEDSVYKEVFGLTNRSWQIAKLKTWEHDHVEAVKDKTIELTAASWPLFHWSD